MNIFNRRQTEESFKRSQNDAIKMITDAQRELVNKLPDYRISFRCTKCSVDSVDSGYSEQYEPANGFPANGFASQASYIALTSVACERIIRKCHNCGYKAEFKTADYKENI
jgi:hypothetical protein